MKRNVFCNVSSDIIIEVFSCSGVLMVLGFFALSDMSWTPVYQRRIIL